MQQAAKGLLTRQVVVIVFRVKRHRRRLVDSRVELVDDGFQFLQVSVSHDVLAKNPLCSRFLLVRQVDMDRVLRSIRRLRGVGIIVRVVDDLVVVAWYVCVYPDEQVPEFFKSLFLFVDVILVGRRFWVRVRGSCQAYLGIQSSGLPALPPALSLFRGFSICKAP